jgi:3-methyladenine DNA glycosylase AlkD
MLLDDLKKFSNQQKAATLQRFFKTGIGQYGQGDKFLGIIVPDIRIVVKDNLHLPAEKIIKSLNSKFHEERLCAFLILVKKFEQGDEVIRKQIFSLYLKSINCINNWDLVDLTAPNIVGLYLLDKNRSKLYTLARSNNLWYRRIAIISCFTFIRNHDFVDALKISEILLQDKHDLIHKAVGWMLREIGKRSRKDELSFLRKYYKVMPRTMLRYAIEKFPETLRLSFLKKSND